VVVDEGADRLAAALRAAGAEVDTDASRMIVTRGTHEGDLHRLVRDSVAATGAPLRRLQRRTISLEERFLEMGT